MIKTITLWHACSASTSWFHSGLSSTSKSHGVKSVNKLLKHGIWFWVWFFLLQVGFLVAITSLPSHNWAVSQSFLCLFGYKIFKYSSCVLCLAVKKCKKRRIIPLFLYCRLVVVMQNKNLLKGWLKVKGWQSWLELLVHKDSWLVVAAQWSEHRWLKTGALGSIPRNCHLFTSLIFPR